MLIQKAKQAVGVASNLEDEDVSTEVTTQVGDLQASAQGNGSEHEAVNGMDCNKATSDLTSHLPQAHGAPTAKDPHSSLGSLEWDTSPTQVDAQDAQPGNNCGQDGPNHLRACNNKLQWPDAHGTSVKAPAHTSPSSDPHKTATHLQVLAVGQVNAAPNGGARHREEVKDKSVGVGGEIVRRDQGSEVACTRCRRMRQEKANGARLLCLPKAVVHIAASAVAANGEGAPVMHRPGPRDPRSKKLLTLRYSKSAPCFASHRCATLTCIGGNQCKHDGARTLGNRIRGRKECNPPGSGWRLPSG